MKKLEQFEKHLSVLEKAYREDMGMHTKICKKIPEKKL